MVGEKLGHYRILAKLGQGGMGEVFEAEDVKLKRRVALKLLSPGIAEGEDQRQRFQREAETIASLNHPNIVTLYSIEQEQGRQFLTMEKVEGDGLDRLVGGGPLALDRIFDIAIAMADALSAAHACDVVHRDLKPANVMLTREGRVKVLDFGLAKLVDAPTGDDEATAALTREGMVLGTVPYMSPEQVQGKAVDHRSDIFSLGVILYEMATGARPFAGENSAELISSILRDTPRAVTEVDARLPHHLGRIVRHCLEKDPARRYQSAVDVRNELEDLRREIDSGVVRSETSALPQRLPARRARWPLIAAVVVGLGLAGLVAWRFLAPRGGAPAIAADAAAAGTSSIAVLYFDNLSEDTDLDWLRSGLTDMLVTDLSQSPELRVLSTDRVYQILSDLNKLDERITSFEVVREVAARGNANTVILGSFARLGDTIQISIKIQEAATGEILRADSVRAVGEEEIFARVDDLSRDIRRSMKLPEKAVTVADRGIAEVTTDSVEAYRYFVEAEKLHNQTKEEEAIELYRKAVEIDPEFALAWAKLGTTHANIRRFADAERFTEKALEHVDRLTEPERAYVEGRFYGQSLATVERAIAVYRETLAKYPHLTALTNNLGSIYNSLWMFDQAIEVFEQGIASGDEFPGTYGSLARAYLASGRERRAIEILEDYLEDHPDSFATYSHLADVHAGLGNLPEAKAALDKVDELRPGDFGNIFGRYLYAVASDDFAAAEAEAMGLERIPIPLAQSAAQSLRIPLAIYNGQGARALELGERAIAAWPGPGPGRAQVRLGVGAGYLQAGEYDRALEHLRATRREDPGNSTDLIAHGLEALALCLSGQEAAGRAMLAGFEERAAFVPGPIFVNFRHEVKGHFAVAAGEPAAAVDHFERAERLLPAYHESTARLWFALANAYLAVERVDDAERMFERIRESVRERLLLPYEYVFSHYRLGRIYEQRDDAERARELYRTFLEYWESGDLERQAIADAERFLANGDVG